ncbi:MAG TPA: type II secretion system protein [Candidatus Saccharimonadales bacterium]|nr:type II secretion system protein [Candidatus Saccharimonadales bacterium]
MTSKFFKRQRGDTIVEVMVVLAIIGLALSVSYAIANRSLLGVRQSQEHSAALQLAQEQLEELRGLYLAGATFDDTTNQCMNLGDQKSGNYCHFDLNTLQTATTTTYFNVLITKVTDCDASDTDATCNKDPNYSDDPNYKITVTWPDVTGHGTDNVSLIYRLPLVGS